LIDSVKNFQTAIKEFVSGLIVLVASLYMAAKDSPMAYIAGVITVIVGLIVFLLVKKVMYERRRKKTDFINIG